MTVKRANILAPLLLSGLLLTTGCVSTGYMVTKSALRTATVAYITKDSESQTQPERAAYVLRVTSKLRGYLEMEKDCTQRDDTLDGLSRYASKMVERSSLSPGSKRLVQALVLEVVFLAGDSSVQAVVLDEVTRFRISRLLDQVDRAALVFSEI